MSSSPPGRDSAEVPLRMWPWKPGKQVPPQNASAAGVGGHDQALASLRPISKDDFCHAIAVKVSHHRRTRARHAPLLDWALSATRWQSQRDNILVRALEYDDRARAR